MDALAEKLGMDPVELRLQQRPDGSARGAADNPPTRPTGLARVPATRGRRPSAGSRRGASRGEAGRGRPGRRGVGMAAGLWEGGAGGPPSTVIVKLFADGSVNLNMGAADIGTGTKTVMAHDRRRGARRAAREDPDRARRHRHDAVRDPERREQDRPRPNRPRCAPRRSTSSEQLLDMAAEELKVPAAELALAGRRRRRRPGDAGEEARGRPTWPGSSGSGSSSASATAARNPEGKVDHPLRGPVLRGRGRHARTGEVRVAPLPRAPRTAAG